MRKMPVLLIVVVAFVTAAAFERVQQKEAGDRQAIQSVLRQKKFSIRCSPLYIPGADEMIPALSGWGNYSWKITTTSDSAQFYFDQGINMYYAFHIIESRASFEKATRFDSTCAMAWWGKALAFGPNINDFGYQRPSEAYPSSVKARQLYANCSTVEKGLIDAMAVRYTGDTATDQGKLNSLYRDAMAKVYTTNSSNVDVNTLYADALMLLHPWDLYDHNYNPKPWTPQIVQVIKHAFTLNAKHPGANHYFIHAVEASAKPEAAMRSAELLSQSMPDVSHITHMPSHIFIRTGYYNKGIKVNDKAVAGYAKYNSSFSPTTENIALYSLHNLHMKLNCAQMAGNYKQAVDASDELSKQIPAFYLSMPGALGNFVQYLDQSKLFTNVRFGKWDEIINIPVADSLTFTPVLQLFARGVAFARKNKIADANAALAALQLKMKNASLKEVLVPFNSAYSSSTIAEKLLAGIIAEQQQDYTSAIAHLQQAVDAEDKLVYNEPRDWLLPARHYLGNALLKAKKYKQAEEVFRKDLVINPNNGWSLTGLKAVYASTNNHRALASMKARINDAWLIRDTEITGAVF
jgi:tetratricopeptide (TPR) repeat protein